MTEDILKRFSQTKNASLSLQARPSQKIQSVLLDFSQRLQKASSDIVAANADDLARMDKDNPLYDRLLLDKARLTAIAKDVENVSGLHPYVGDIVEERVLPNGARLSRVRVPLGVAGVIYEARPNVTVDVFSLCLRTHNACILKGSSDAESTNAALIRVIHDTLTAHDFPSELVYLMPPAREHLPVMLKAYGLIDVCIPRGSQGLIDFVRENASIPVIETGRGVVHVYFDETGDIKKGRDIVINAKTRRPSVCNSLDTLLIHDSRISDLTSLLVGLADKEVFIQADTKCHQMLKEIYPAHLVGTLSPDDFDTEFLGLKMNIAAVPNLPAALAHIRQYGSGHTDCIVTEDKTIAETFLNAVDSAVVMHNVSTAFSDGGEFDLGAEIGISTQKLHARGPMGLEALTSYKWVLQGNGQVR